MFLNLKYFIHFLQDLLEAVLPTTMGTKNAPVRRLPKWQNDEVRELFLAAIEFRSVIDFPRSGSGSTGTENDKKNAWEEIVGKPKAMMKL